MLKPRQIYCFVAIALLVANNAFAQIEVKAQSKLPDWLKNRIAKIEATPKFAEATAIWKIKYKKKDAYLFVAPCCDQFSSLYNAAGLALCSPSGGITGRGDGKCPDSITPKTKFVVVWKLPESGKK